MEAPPARIARTSAQLLGGSKFYKGAASSTVIQDLLWRATCGKEARQQRQNRIRDDALLRERRRGQKSPIVYRSQVSCLHGSAGMHPLERQYESAPTAKSTADKESRQEDRSSAGGASCLASSVSGSFRSGVARSSTPRDEALGSFGAPVSFSSDRPNLPMLPVRRIKPRSLGPETHGRVRGRKTRRGGRGHGQRRQSCSIDRSGQNARLFEKSATGQKRYIQHSNRSISRSGGTNARSGRRFAGTDSEISSVRERS